MVASSGRRRSLGEDFRAVFLLLAALAGGLWFFGTAINNIGFQPSALVIASFMPACVSLLYAILREAEQRPYSLHVMHLLGCALLLVAAPLLQYITNSFPTAGLPRLREAEVLVANLQVFSWIVAYLVGYHRSSQGRHLKAPLVLLEREATPRRASLIVAIGVLALAYLAYRGTAFALTRAAFGAAHGARTPMEHLFLMFPRTMPMLSFLALVLLRSQIRPSRRLPIDIGLFLLGVGILVFNNPLAGARIWTLTNALAVAVVMVLWRFKTATLLLPLMATAPVILPLLNVGRTNRKLSADLLMTQSGSGAQDPMLSGDFDAYQNLVLLNRLIDATDIVWGQQLLGSLLFWVPRAFWPGKPVGTGAFLAEQINLPWKNVAMPLPGEAYVNFGWFGIFAAGIGFGILLRYLDHRYFAHRSPSRVRLLVALFPLWLGFIVFATRGDLMNSVAFFAAVTLSAAITMLLSSHAASKPPPDGSALAATKPGALLETNSPGS